LKFYADVHKTKKNDEGYRITYTTDGKSFQARRQLRRDPCWARRQAIHGYTTTPAHRRRDRTTREGGEVYYLGRLTLLEKIRREYKLPKSARGDIKTLMNIEERWLRRVT
jgi:hypothetical protein